VRVFVYVEGEADKLALGALLRRYREKLGDHGHGLRFIVLGSKDIFFRRTKFPAKAAANLVDREDNHVVALPDLYPNQPYASTPNAHRDLGQLCARLGSLVKQALRDVFGVRARDLPQAMSRFHPSALKYDLEMLLLAAWQRLAEQLGQAVDPAAHWRRPVEDQDQNRPPKRIVEKLFLARTDRAYRDTIHAPAVLRRVEDLREVLQLRTGEQQCPVFERMLEWIAHQTGVSPYDHTTSRERDA
jgi:hypothetical protein